MDLATLLQNVGRQAQTAMQPEDPWARLNRTGIAMLDATGRPGAPTVSRNLAAGDAARSNKASKLLNTYAQMYGLQAADERFGKTHGLNVKRFTADQEWRKDQGRRADESLRLQGITTKAQADLAGYRGELYKAQVLEKLKKSRGILSLGNALSKLPEGHEARVAYDAGEYKKAIDLLWQSSDRKLKLDISKARARAQLGKLQHALQRIPQIEDTLRAGGLSPEKKVQLERELSVHKRIVSKESLLPKTYTDQLASISNAAWGAVNMAKLVSRKDFHPANKLLKTQLIDRIRQMRGLITMNLATAYARGANFTEMEASLVREVAGGDPLEVYRWITQGGQGGYVARLKILHGAMIKMKNNLMEAMRSGDIKIAPWPKELKTGKITIPQGKFGRAMKGFKK